MTSALYVSGHREAKREPIAIVDIGCRLPGGIGHPGQFWEFLCKGGDAISDVPRSRWDADVLFASEATVTQSSRGCRLLQKLVRPRLG